MFDFSGYTTPFTDNEVYWVVFGDGTASDFTYSIRSKSGAYYTHNTSIQLYNATDTTGFATTSTQVTATPIILVFSDGTIIGMPYTNTATDTSNTLERGLYTEGFTEQISLIGIEFFSGGTAMSTFQIYQGSTAPGGTVWAGFNGGSALTVSAHQQAVGMLYFPSPVTLAKNTVYRFTFKFSSASTVIGYNIVEDPGTPGNDALGCCLGQGHFCRTIDNGGGGWTTFNNTSDGMMLTRMNLLLDDQVSVAGGGGGGAF